MPTERRLAVLRAIVEDYVSTREPVGSKALVERHSLGVSPATIRNDMAALEEEGLITAPHTSAGRIPTDKGYRLFVDRLSEIKPLSTAERTAIRQLLDGAESVDEMMMRSVRLLSQLTHQAALIQYPVASAAVAKSVELVSLSENTVLVVLVVSTGAVAQRTLSTPLLSESELQTARTILRSLVLDLPLPLAGERARGAAETQAGLRLQSDPSGEWTAHAARVLAEMCESFSTSRIAMSGTAHLARSNSDFASTITPVLEALEEQVVLMKLLAEMAREDRDLEVRIGHENDGALSETAVVLAHYGTAAAQDGALGVIGPTRMDYSGSMSAVRAVARYITGILQSTEQRNSLP